jgi:pyridoxal phosphate enzyme (YggS family)
LVARVAANLTQVRERIARVSAEGTVRIVAVTKTFGREAVLAGLECGLTDFGENYVAELEEKASSGPSEAQWHYLGALQGNKIARIAARATVIESLSRVSELDKLARLEYSGECLLQLDLTGQEGRNGASPTDVATLATHARARGLALNGLMMVAPPGPDARGAFLEARRIADDLGLAERSFGMTEDLEWAIEAGSTQIRIGRALFGAREAQ